MHNLIIAFLVFAADAPKEPGLVASWLFTFLGGTSDAITFIDSTHLKQKSLIGGLLYLDIEATYEIDGTASPKRYVLTATKVNPSQVIKMSVGSQMFCIYRLGADVLDANCDRDDYPADFAEGISYSKRNLRFSPARPKE